MLRLMIVDDDEILRNGLVHNICWSEKNIEVVGTAKNGKEAVEKISVLAPDLILSDVQMPFMDGLELAEYVSKAYPDIKLILLTAFEIFEYAQRALKYGVTSYILKYESNDKILHEVEEAAERYMRECESRRLVQEGKKQMRYELIRDLCWKELNSVEIQKRMQLCEWINTDVEYGILICYVGGSETEKTLNYLNRVRKTGNRIKSILMNYVQEVYIFSDEHYTIFLTEQEKNLEWNLVLNELEESIHLWNKKEQMEILCGTDETENKLEQIHEKYKHSKEALEKEMLLVHSENSSRIAIYGTSRHGQGQGAEIIEKIKNIINRRYGDEKLSLNIIADEVFLSANYISSLFKKQEQMTISDYIMQVRISKAKKLLSSTNYKTYEVANMVGYTNSQYFSVLFKRVTGYSPTEYKQINLE